ncbi:MAG TPA: TonB-dependent receptor [Bryobacteraceae bacterium]|nr:TonB-dependent receptor [Bryobacteraceae bacterium]
MRPLLIVGLLAAGGLLRAADNTPDPADPAGEAALFGDLPVVEAASLHAQTLEQAPANVTIVTAGDIRKYGYRTLSDVLSAVRGFTMIRNHVSSSSGVRGLAAPGDVNTCFLVMINGHPMSEIIGQSNSLFDQDFGLDLDLVARIEIIRGPSSALYGSNGILATINIVTQSPVDAPHFQVSAETGGFQPGKLEFLTSQDLGRGANLLIEGSGFMGPGWNLFLPAFDTPAQNNGIANHVEAQNGYHSFVNLQWGAWNFTAYCNDWLERGPILTEGTWYNDQGQFHRISRNFAGATYTHDFAGGGELRWQIDYDQFRYQDRYDYVTDFGALDNRDSAFGDWIDSQLTYSQNVSRVGLLTAGLSGKFEIRSLVENADYSPDRALNLSISHPDRSIAPFLQQEWDIARDWKAYLGVRWDESANYGSFVSPRLALVYQPGSRTSYKVVYGRPFRAPSVYEMFYQDGITQVANPKLRPESAQGVEVSVERKVGRSAYVLANAFDYDMHAVIQTVWLTSSVSQYQNAGARNSRGIEFELGGHLRPWLETTASLTLDHAVETDAHAALPNSPGRTAKLRAAIPVYRDRVYFSSDFQCLNARATVDQTFTRPVALWNATLSSNRLLRGFDFVAGVRNALNWSYGDPITWPLDSSIDQIPANGRSAFVKLIWRHGE